MVAESFSFGTPGLGNEQDGSTIYVLATQFTASTTGTWTGNEWYAPTSSDGINHYILAYDNGSLVGSKAITPTFGGGLQQFSFDTPISITSGHTYQACILTSRYTATVGYFATTDATTASMTADHTANGRFFVTTADTPHTADTATGNLYHISPIVTFGAPENHNVSAAATLGLAIADTIKKGGKGSAAPTLGLSASETGRKTNASVSAGSTLVFALSAHITAPVTDVQTGSWWGLVGILREARQEYVWQSQRVPTACPNDGEPLRSGPDGSLFCPYDGWSWSG